MSLGTAVGDILACARHAYKLYQEMSKVHGSSREYWTLSSRLLTVHKVLLQVEQLRAANQLTQSTLNAIRFLASRMSEAITGFVNRLEDFEKVSSPDNFFRPGRVFTVAVRGISTATGDEDVDCTHLPGKWIPLDSISDPYEREKERLSRQKKNYKDVIKLPLPAMFQYGDVQKNGLVRCHLCPGDIRFPKDFWVDRHFRIYHHETYNKLHDVSSLDERIGYIYLDEMSTDRPILSESEIEEMISNEYNLPTWDMDPWVGAITIRRFVVVQQGRGCSDQPDQELYAILYSSKYIPDPLPEETRMNSQPIRLKLEQLSTVLPSTARVHFGRVYEIKHDVELNNVGLVHGSSMDILSSQFESHRPIDTPNGVASSPDRYQAGTSAGDTVTQTDVKVEK
ncbi:hypothetical protein AtubIFM54640_004048 [Aspergillus tubingensis]|nr:hypothetical protein AtubIFM54640_004048 [Aspergillus tubingensis]